MILKFVPGRLEKFYNLKIDPDFHDFVFFTHACRVFAKKLFMLALRMLSMHYNCVGTQKNFGGSYSWSKIKIVYDWFSAHTQVLKTIFKNFTLR